MGMVLRRSTTLCTCPSECSKAVRSIVSFIALIFFSRSVPSIVFNRATGEDFRGGLRTGKRPEAPTKPGSILDTLRLARGPRIRG